MLDILRVVETFLWLSISNKIACYYSRMESGRKQGASEHLMQQKKVGNTQDSDGSGNGEFSATSPRIHSTTNSKEYPL